MAGLRSGALSGNPDLTAAKVKQILEQTAANHSRTSRSSKMMRIISSFAQFESLGSLVVVRIGMAHRLQMATDYCCG
jgi:hypothetical protein